MYKMTDYCPDCYKTKEILDSVVGFFPIDSMLCMGCNKNVDKNIPRENPYTKDKVQVIVNEIIKN